MKKTIVGVVLLSVMLFGSCTDAERSRIGGYGDEFKVELVNCDGSITHSWISSGKVKSEQTSDGYYFNDKETDVLIEVTGTLIITAQ